MHYETKVTLTGNMTSKMPLANVNKYAFSKSFRKFTWKTSLIDSAFCKVLFCFNFESSFEDLFSFYQAIGFWMIVSIQWYFNFVIKRLLPRGWYFHYWSSLKNIQCRKCRNKTKTSLLMLTLLIIAFAWNA